VDVTISHPAQQTVINRILATLRTQVDANHELTISTRRLAELADCAVSRVGPSLERLEAKGMLVHTASRKQGTHIRLLPPGLDTTVVIPSAVPGTRRGAKLAKRVAAQAGTSGLTLELERLEQMWRRGALNDDEFKAFKQTLHENYRRRDG
jgi:hypothetical protein